jgi:hypothetical protein
MQIDPGFISARSPAGLSGEKPYVAGVGGFVRRASCWRHSRWWLPPIMILENGAVPGSPAAASRHCTHSTWKPGELS